MPLMRRALLIICLITRCSISFAQSGSDEIEVTGLEGIKVFSPHKNYVEGHPLGVELGYHFGLRDDSLAYARMLGIKYFDIVGSYRTLNSLTINHDPSTKGILGDVYSLTGRLDIQLLKTGPVSLQFTPGFGFAYSTTSYFSDQNPLIATKLNLAVQAGLKVLAPLTPSTTLQAGIDVFHYSDGAIGVPNNGINAFNVSIGLLQSFKFVSFSTPKNPFSYNNTGAIEFGGDFGQRGVYHKDAELYRAGIYAGYSYKVNTVFRVKAGLDADHYFTPFNNSSTAAFNATYESLATSYDKWSLGLSAGGDLNMGRLTVMASYGYYLHFHSYNDVHFYWTPGLKYYVLPWVAVQGKLYIHGTEADYLGLGLIFRIHT